MIVSSKDPTVADIVKAIGSRKHNVIVGNYNIGAYVMTGWHGGSCEEHYAVYPGGHVQRLSTVMDPNRDCDPYGQRHILPKYPEGAVAVVKIGTWRGKPSTPVIMFPKPNDPLQ